MRPNDGGESAFPRMTYDDSRMAGMSLRDYFAARAMQGYLSDEANLRGMLDVAARRQMEMSQTLAMVAYEIADAMLAERAK